MRYEDKEKLWEQAKPEDLNALWESAAPKEQKKEEIDYSNAPPGFVKGLRDPIDALAQILYNSIPDNIKNKGDELNNWIAEKTGILTKIPEGGLNEMISTEEKKYQAKRRAEGDKGLDLDRIAGGITSTMLLPGTGVTKVATTFPGKLATGMLTGAAYGSLNPVSNGDDFWEEKAKQAGTGALLGTVVPVASAGVKYLDETLKPFYKKGIARDVKKFLLEKTGSEREKIIDAIQKRKQLVEGNKPTAAQAVAQAQKPSENFGGQIVRLEADLAKTPVIGSKLKNKYTLQQDNRKKIIDAIAKTKDDLEKAKTLRTNITDPLYKATDDSLSMVNINPVMNKINNYIAKNPNQDDIVKPLRGLIKKIKKGHTTLKMKSLSQEIKTMMGKTTPGGQREYDVGALNDIKKVLDQEIGKAAPTYKLAQESYKELSKPINRMEVGRELKKSLQDAETIETPGKYLSAIENAANTLKKATGFKRYKNLGQVLSKEQMQGVKNVADDLINQAKVKKMSKETDSILKDLPSEISFNLPHILSRPVVVANHFLSMVGKDKSPEYKKILIDLLEDPKKLEKTLTLPKYHTESKILSEILKDLTTIGIINTHSKEKVIDSMMRSEQ